MGSILGGGGGKSSSTQTSGYAALPPALRAVFDELGKAVGQYTNPNTPGNVDRFTPMQQTADETAAFEAIRRGFAPTSQSISSDIAMQMNPFDQAVIDTINREAQGSNSILQQNLSQAGQFGSNRGMLGANDIDLTRLNQIGTFKQGQFNNALQNALTILPQSRAADAQGMLGIGGFQRGLDFSTRQAPISALQAGTGMIAPFTAGGTGTSTQSQGGSGLLGGLGGLASGIGTAWTAFSDVNMKENIEEIGIESGHKIYEFSYKGNPKRYIGVMAQDVIKIHPEAVMHTPNGLMVDYSLIGVRFREAE